MRKSRYALAIAVVFGSLLVSLTPALGTTATKEVPQWKSSKTHVATPLRTMLLTSEALTPIATYASAVVAYQESQYLMAISSSENAARTSATSTNVSASPSTSAPTGDLMAAWTRVAVCEEGGWIGYAGPAYPDSLGIDAQNWYAYGGGSDLSPATQIAVAQRLLAANGQAGWIPDQGYCASW